MHIPPTAGCFHSIFCNDVRLLQEHQNTSKHVIWCSGWSSVDTWREK